MPATDEIFTLSADGHGLPNGRELWINPIIHWNGCDKNRYIAEKRLPKNPVVELLCMSGECLCGSFAKPNEIEEIRTWFPKAAEEIDRLSGIAETAGRHCVWGTRPPNDDPNQERFEFGPMCHSCAAKLERLESETQNNLLPNQIRRTTTDKGRR